MGFIRPSSLIILSLSLTFSLISSVKIEINLVKDGPFGAYKIPIGVGDRQTLSLDLDFNQADSWLMSVTCLSGRCWSEPGEKYNGWRSGTSQAGYQPTYFQSLNGSWIYGISAFDRFSLRDANAQANSTSIMIANQIFLSGVQVSHEYPSPGIGALGIGKPKHRILNYPTLLENLIATKAIYHSMFTITPQTDDDEELRIVFGDCNEYAKTEEQTIHAKVKNSSKWMFPLTDVAFLSEDTQSIEGLSPSCENVVQFSLSEHFIVGPRVVAQKIAQRVGARSVGFRGNLTAYRFDRTVAKNIHSWPNIMIEGFDKLLEMHPEDMIITLGGVEYLLFAGRDDASEGLPLWTFGAGFFRKYSVVFDWNKETVAISKREIF